MYSVHIIYVAIIAIHRIILLYLPSQFCRKIIYYNKYAQRAYDLYCNYCNTHNYYSILFLIVTILVVCMFGTIYGTHQHTPDTDTEDDDDVLVFYTY